MCIGVPMRVAAADGLVARARSRAGEERAVGLALVGEQAAGTWVLVHLDTAIRVLDEGEAGLIADALDGLAASLRGEDFEHLFADLVNRTPELPPHLRAAAGQDTPREAAE